MVVNLIANTTTTKELKVMAVLDEGHYPIGMGISDEQVLSLHTTKSA